jgi:hypothetical protein
MFKYFKNIYEYLHIWLIEHEIIKIDFDFIMLDIVHYMYKEEIYVLSWLKRKGCFNDYFVSIKDLIYLSIKYKLYTSLKWFYKNFKFKQVMKWSKNTKYCKSIKIKTKNNYIKGYNKN